MALGGTSRIGRIVIYPGRDLAAGATAHAFIDPRDLALLSSVPQIDIGVFLIVLALAQLSGKPVGWSVPDRNPAPDGPKVIKDWVQTVQSLPDLALTDQSRKEDTSMRILAAGRIGPWTFLFAFRFGRPTWY